MEEYIKKSAIIEEFTRRQQAWEDAAEINWDSAANYELAHEYKGMARAYKNVCATVELWSPANVTEVKYGEWINDKGLYKCSVCNEFWSHWWASVVGDERMNKMMKFCPNCGADMRGENK